ncbi:DUF6538 domain-containing protein [Microvirga ossetica]|uniref:DUF6538 domain-containing protein n=1 Tax=Microvirga ossetica TaxID=1882682 RepID=UPI003AAF0917
MKLSLRTTDPHEARRLHAVALAGLDANWKALRERTPLDARPAKRVDLTEKDAHTLASQLYGQIVRASDRK